MRKVLLGASAILLAVAAVSFSVLLPSPGSGTALADGAVVIQGTQCRIFDGAGRVVLVSGRSQKVRAGGPSGVVKFICHAKVRTVPAGGKAKEWNFENTGRACSTGFGQTRDWREVVTPSGQAVLTCFINPNGGP